MDKLTEVLDENFSDTEIMQICAPPDFAPAKMEADELMQVSVLEYLLSLSEISQIFMIKECFRRAIKLKIENKFELHYNAFMKSKSPDLEYVGNMTLKQELPEDVRELPEWVFAKVNKKGDIEYKVDVRKLRDHIEKTENFIYLCGSQNKKPERYIYKNGVYKCICDENLKGIIKNHIPGYLQLPYDIETTFKLIDYTDTDTKEYSDLNSNENLINFQNGLLDINTMELKPHTPDEYFTIQLPLEYDPEAVESPVFDKYLEDLTEGDINKKNLILELMGIALSNIDCNEKLKAGVFMVGKGDSGKSQIKLLLSKLLGEKNCSSIDLTKLEERFGTSAIYGKRLVGSNDMKFATVKEMNAYKQLTGGDEIIAEKKGGAHFSFKFRGLLWFCMNQLPSFGGDRGDWVYNRIIIIQCNNSIPKENQDKNLVKKMYAERAAIVNKALAALKALEARNFILTMPEDSKQASEEYKIENSPVRKFYKECCIERSDGFKDSMTTKRIYDAYTRWCKDNAPHSAASNQNFRKELQNMLGTKNIVRKNHGQTYYIFTITQETKKDYGFYDTIG